MLELLGLQDDYSDLENQLTSITKQRDWLANQMITILEQAEFDNQVADAQQAQWLIDQGNDLIQQVSRLAAGA
jgi:hypothetical protein